MSTVKKEMVSWYYSENAFDLTDLPKESWDTLAPTDYSLRITIQKHRWKKFKGNNMSDQN